MTENKRFTLHKGLDTLNIMDNTKFNEHIYINKSSKDMKLLVGVLNTLHEENQELKAQLLYDGDDVCGICKHEYLVPSGDYFIGKCEKGHEECSKEDIRYCKDFELKGDVE